MEQKANQRIDGNMPVQMSETHLEVLRSYGFQFGAKTGSRFIAAVHEIVGIVAQDKIETMVKQLGDKQEENKKLTDDLFAERLARTNEQKAASAEKESLVKKLAEHEESAGKALAHIADLKLSADLLTAGTGRMAERVTKARNHAATNPNDLQAQVVLCACERMVNVFSGEEKPAEPLSMSMFATKDDYDKAVAAETAVTTEEKIVEAENRG
jgi:hypothetical protein